jgi:trigger factor
MSVVVSIQDAGPCRKELTIQVPAAAVEAESLRVAQEFGRGAKIPGFRKGKVPMAMLRRRFEHDIQHEVVDRLVPRFWRQAQAEANLDPLLPPRVSGVEIKPGEPLKFVATVEVRPEIELRNIRDFNLPELDTRATPDDLERALEDLRGAAATWPPAERAAGRGDRVTGTLQPLGLIVAPGATGSGAGQPVEFEVGDPAIWEELTLAATGLAAGQSTEFERVPPAEGAIAPAHPGPAERFRLQVDAVLERRLPPLDDPFAARVGNFADLGALKEAIGERIAEAKRLERRRRRETAVLDQLRERHPLELPAAVVEQEQESLLREYAEAMARRGMDPEKAQVNWPALAEEVKPQAEKRVHARLLLDAIAEAEGLAVGEDEFERALATIARAEGRTTSAVRSALDQHGRLQPLRAQLRREKMLGRLIGDDSPPPAAAAAAPAGD